VIALAGLLLAGAAAAQPAKVEPAADLHWVEIRKPDGTPSGVQAVDLWGDAKMGAHGSLAKFPAGMKEPLHTHTHELRVVVFDGTLRYVIDGVETKDLARGSALIIPASVPHYAQCLAPAPCEVLVQQDGAMDVKPVAGP
jgi:quercetin dioxygenase-like cupin family protein